MENEERAPWLVEAATVMTLEQLAGRALAAGWFSLPAATTTGTPRFTAALIAFW